MSPTLHSAQPFRLAAASLGTDGGGATHHRPAWSTATVERLEEVGCTNLTHRWFAGLEHSVREDELEVVSAWLREVLPEV